MLTYMLRRLGQSALTIFGVMLLTFLLFRVWVVGDIAAANINSPHPTEKQKAEWRVKYGYNRPLVFNHARQIVIRDLTTGRNKFAVIEDEKAGSNAVGALELTVDFGRASAGRKPLPPPKPDEDAEEREDADVHEAAPDESLTTGPAGDLSPPDDEPQTADDEASPAADETPPTAADVAGDAPLQLAEPVSPEVLSEALAEADPDMPTIKGRYIQSGPFSRTPSLTRDTPVEVLLTNTMIRMKDNAEGQVSRLTNDPTSSIPDPRALMTFQTAGGARVRVDLSGVRTAGDVLDRVNNAPTNRDDQGRPLVHADISTWTVGQLFDSQFFHHLKNSVTFQSRSFKTDKLLTETIRERALYSLAIMVPATALEFLLGLAIAAFVAYYRGRMIDRVGVFVSVLGMCIPFLAWMIYGQKLVELISPSHAYGTFYQTSLYVPIAILVIAGLGGMVRFYRTVILDETSRDYVRTARAKGVSLPNILFKHVLKNCMLPILTQVILSLPFLIMGSLLVESYFGIPGLGDLLYTSIRSGDEPVLTGLVFLTALVYTLCILLTDISYAIFDPRVRLT